MMVPFEAIGDRARWRIVYEDVLRGMDHGDLVTYERLGDVLTLDPEQDRHAIQMAVRRAGKDFEEVDKMALDVIPNQGYRIVQAVEHMALAQRQQRRSHRALKAGKSKVVNVDLSGMEPEVRQAFEVMGRAFSLQMDFNRRMDVRQKNLEDVLDTVSERQARSESELTDLRERLARLEGERLEGEREV